MNLKVGIHQRFPGADLSGGVKGSFFHPAYRSHPKSIPYRSVRDLLHSMEWPGSFNFIGDYPENSSPGWTNNIQGVTHDANHWFFTQADRLWKIPLSHDLNQHVSQSDFPNAPIPNALRDAGGNHMGSLDFFENLLYVPLEGTSPPSLLIFEAATLQFLGSGPLVQQNDAPWCAVNPRNRLLYTSHFNSKALFDSEPLIVYRPNIIADTSGGIIGADPEFLYHFDLFGGNGGPIAPTRIQSGTFSPSGHFYLLSDVDDGGLMGFDMTTGRLIFQKTRNSFPAGVEMEGVTVFDIDGRGAPNLGGQIHIVWDDLEPGSDDVYFSHLQVAPASRGAV